MNKKELQKIRKEDKQLSKKYGNKFGNGTAEYFIIGKNAMEEIQKLISKDFLKETSFELGLDLDKIITESKPYTCKVCNSNKIHSHINGEFLCKKCFNKEYKKI